MYINFERMWREVQTQYHSLPLHYGITHPTGGTDVMETLHVGFKYGRPYRVKVYYTKYEMVNCNGDTLYDRLKKELIHKINSCIDGRSQGLNGPVPQETLTTNKLLLLI